LSLEREGTVASPARFGLNPASFACRMLALFVLATLASLALPLAHTRADMNKAESSALADAASIAATAALEIDDVVARARHVAEAVERLPEFWGGDDAARDATLAALAAPQPVFNALTYYTTDLQQHGVSNYRPGMARPSGADRAYAREALATEGSRWPTRRCGPAPTVP
jgi:hypothetical protein